MSSPCVQRRLAARRLRGVCPLAALLLPAAARALDTDLDGLHDPDEVLLGTDPVRWDTDGDSVGDGAEIQVCDSDPRVDERGCAPWPEAVLAEFAFHVTTADLDVDGDPDVLVGSTELGWIENLGGGAFGPLEVISLHPNAAVRVEAADIDRDGDPDLVASDAWQGEVWWVENLGYRAFGLPQQVGGAEAYDGTAGVFPADLDTDGDIDILSAEYFEVVWYENRDRGTFGPPRVIDRDSSATSSVHAADLDDDGDLDVLATAEGWDEAVWFENLGGGSFGGEQLVGVVDRPMSVVAADLDGDGDADGLAATWTEGMVWWFENLGGGFGPARAVTSEPSPMARMVRAADLDGDGDVDVLSAHGDRVVWTPNLGGAVFAPTQAVLTRSEQVGWSSANVGDLDGDGTLDVVSGYPVAVHLSPLADADGDWLSGAVEHCLTQTLPGARDSDGGGVADGDEILVRTDPRDPGDDVFPPDADGDGLPDDAERHWHGTDPWISDSDGDGLADDEEILLWTTDPVGPDTDGDDLSDGDEALVHGTDPMRIDTDDDRLSDGVEVRFGLDPLDSDSDDDGILDGVEVHLGTDPARPDPDSDGDGLADPAEVEVGTDPALPDTDGDWLGDGEEVLTWLSDPLTWDTDADSVPDGAEILVLGTDLLFDERRCAQWDRTAIATTATGADAVDATDLDGDGDVDVVYAGTAAVAFFENLGAGGFGPGITLRQEGANWVFTEDLDGDRDRDVLVGVYQAVYAYENLAGRGFGPARELPHDVGVSEAGYAADVDRDGDRDVLCAVPDELRVYENLGGMRFAPARSITNTPRSYGWNSVHAADLDEDGDVDVVGGAWYFDFEDVYPHLAWVENDGAGRFGYGFPYTIEDYYVARDVQGVDLDGDGDTDVLAGTRPVSWFENRGGGDFGLARLLYDTDSNTEAILAVDLDGDHDPEVLSASPYEIAVSPNLGGGSFGPRLWIDRFWGEAGSVDAADVDGDGDPDVLATHRSHDLVAWYRNTTADNDRDRLAEAVELCLTGTDPSTWDTDGGGTPDGEELLVLTDPRDPADDVPAYDADGDGVPDDAEIHWHRSDPGDTDTDGGGAPDGAELAFGSDPTNRADDRRLAVVPFPGDPYRWDIGFASPEATVAVMFGTAPGNTPVPGCPGKFLAMANPEDLGSASVDHLGAAVVSRPRTGPRASFDIGWYQVLESSTCSVSAPVAGGAP